MKKIIKSNGVSTTLNMLKEEYVLTKGSGKYILLAVFFNIPFIGFIPYLTQAFTIILLSIFLKNHLKMKEASKKEAINENKVGYILSKAGFILIIITMAFQVLWFPFISQLITLVLLGIIYATMTKYKQPVSD